MNILVVHGYVLSGTGSNLYIRNIVKKMCEFNQDVILVCQEFNPENYDFIGRVYKQDGAHYKLLFDRKTKYKGSCILYIPDIRNKLLVYVYDKYQEMIVKEMQNTTKGTINEYISLNSKCILHILKQHQISKILSSHLVLQPQYVAKALERIANKPKHYVIGHGSDLTYAIKNSDFLAKLSYDTLSSISGLIAVSDFSKQQMQDYYCDLDLSKTKTISAGIDENIFVEQTKEVNFRMLEKYLIKNENNEGFSLKQRNIVSSMMNNHIFDFKNIDKTYEPKTLEQNISDRLLNLLKDDKKEKIIYLGKYLEQKGIISLLLSLPILFNDRPNLNVIFIGFGALRTKLEYIIDILENHNVSILFDKPSKLGLNAKTTQEVLLQLDLYLKDETQYTNYINGCKYLRTNIIFTGYMDQKYAITVMKYCDIAIFPSIHPEAFGMVVIEAMAAKTLPLVAKHSGFLETLEAVSRNTNAFKVDDLAIPIDKNMITSLVDMIEYNLDNKNYIDMDKLSKFVIENYGWHHIVNQIIEL